jgi:hypothetical protein
LRRRLRTVFLAGAILICAILFGALIHDFSLPDPQHGWLTGNPALPIVLLVIGYLCMVGHRVTSRQTEEE